MAVTLQPCRCVHLSDRFLIDGPGGGRTYQDCEVCRGIGFVSRDCVDCRRTGRLRVQLVLTVANLDTGAVASANVVPGAVEPRRGPAAGRWQLELSPLVADLAATVGAATWRDVAAPERTPAEFGLLLPRDWDPGLPHAERYALEARAIARHAWNPWRVFLGSSTTPPPLDLGCELGRLCRLADLLCLDLVVEARRRPYGGLSWDVRYETPGAEVPAEQRGWAESLSAAISATTVADAMWGLAERSLTAPAHYLRPRAPGRAGVPEQTSRAARDSDGESVPADGRDQVSPPPTVDLDQLERRLVDDLSGSPRGVDAPSQRGRGDVAGVISRGGASAAQAVWREGRWWHIQLRPGGQTEVLVEQDTGQISHRRVTILLRNCEPPAPSWRGDPIPHTPCPDCDPRNRLRPCRCTFGNRPARSDCPTCFGAGVSAIPSPCSVCGGTRRVHHGTVVTITDLSDRVIHLNWSSTGAPTSCPQVATQPGGKPVHHLPRPYRLARWARHFGVRPEDLTRLDGGHPVGQDLCDGVVTVDRPGMDPLAAHVGIVSRGQPGARLLIAAESPRAPAVTELIRLAAGLWLALDVTVEDHRRNAHDPRWIHGERWHLEMVGPAAPIRRQDPYQPTVEAAARHCVEYLETMLAQAVPDDPERPIAIPQTPRPATPDADPVPLLRRLGHYHAGEPVTVRFGPASCQVYAHERAGIRRLASAATLSAAMAALGLGTVPET